MHYQDCIRYDGHCNRRTDGNCPPDCSGYVPGSSSTVIRDLPHLKRDQLNITGRRNGMNRVRG